jgi:hypothetical protein
MDCKPSRTHNAMRAAQAVAGRHGLSCNEPRVLHDANNVVVHLAPSPVVAKICGSANGGGRIKLANELNVALHLERSGAPIVEASRDLPIQTYEEGGFAMTFWRHQAQDAHAAIPEAQAGRARLPRCFARSV